MPQDELAAAPEPRVVIIGGGFGGLAAARALRSAPVQVTLVDRTNHHLFQPLLYQVATAALSPADIAWPIRNLLRGQDNVRVVLGEVTGVDTAQKLVQRAEGPGLPYDTLIIATGAQHTYFGNDAWAPFAPGLKTLDDATALRRRILMAFETAETTEDADERAALMTFVVVGAGPTGVEMAGAIAELSHRTLAGQFQRINPAQTRVLMVEAGPRVLAGMAEGLSAKAEVALKKLGVEVHLGAPVKVLPDGNAELGGTVIPTRNIIWAAGVAASPAAKWVDAKADRAGRVEVAADLTVPDHPDIFVVGDTALVPQDEGFAPGIAPAAKQMGAYAARVVKARLADVPAPAPFRYKDAGTMATIGRNAAVAQVGGLKVSGFIAWILWAVAHIYFLIGTRNRLVVAIHWAWMWVTHSRGARLITGSSGASGTSATSGISGASDRPKTAVQRAAG